jgi:NADH-quinone oxidoreductase subunit M
MLWMLQRVVFGRITNPANATLTDLSWREKGLLIPLLGLMLYMGVYPRPFLAQSSESIRSVQERVSEQQPGGRFAEIFSK